MDDSNDAEQNILWPVWRSGLTDRNTVNAIQSIVLSDPVGSVFMKANSLDEPSSFDKMLNPPKGFWYLD